MEHGPKIPTPRWLKFGILLSRYISISHTRLAASIHEALRALNELAECWPLFAAGEYLRRKYDGCPVPERGSCQCIRVRR